jgi:hypothetical protein
MKLPQVRQTKKALMRLFRFLRYSRSNPKATAEPADRHVSRKVRA